MEPIVKLHFYTGNKITAVGEKLVNVVMGDQGAQIRVQRSELTLIVVEGEGPPLLGSTWLQGIKLP